jgi:chemosensory pili system protein ChpA (sensor histidine kinase/response regulator)
MSALLDYDTGPLNWVRGDIDAALQAALGRVQAYSLDAELTNALRLAADDAHQVTGALRMVGLEGAATLAAALESCLVDVNENRLPANDELLRALRNALEGLQRWVKDLADGRGSGELALFPLYKRLRELQGVERIFEGELFFPDLRARAHGKGADNGLTQEALAAQVRASRGQFQRGLLAFLRNVEAEAGLRRMREALAAIERIAPSQASQSFWWACVGFVDSLIAHGVDADFHVKQLLARVDLQMRRLMEGSPEVAERLMRDALFFVAKSQALDGRAAEIRSTLGLDRYLPGRGMLDPEALARMRPLLDALQTSMKAARDAWHGHVEGDTAQLDQFQAHLARMLPQAQMLDTSGLKPLFDTLGVAASATGSRQGDARELGNLEIAATLLFLQNALANEDVLHADFAARAASQQARLAALVAGEPLPANAADADSLRAAERDMLVQMAQEVGQNLKQMEEALDAFFRDPAQREALSGLPALAQQAQGALTMLEVPDAAKLLAAANAAALPFAAAGEPDAAMQARLADAFSSLGLFIESYCAGRADAATILQPVLVEFGLAASARAAGDALEFASAPFGAGAKKKLAEPDPRADEARPAADAGLDGVVAAMDVLGAGSLRAGLDPVTADVPSTTANPADGGDLAIEFFTYEIEAPTAEPVVAPPASHDAIDFPAPVVEVAPPALTPPTPKTAAAKPAAPKPAAPPEITGRVTIPEGVEPELLDIFLEEAREVLGNMGDAADTCRSNPTDNEALTVVRRAFHTLKGSGRMVGLTELGETAWRLEQLMNGWLAETKPATSDLLVLVERARAVLLAWVDALQAGRVDTLPIPALLADVERVAQGRAPGDALPSGSQPTELAQSAVPQPEVLQTELPQSEPPLVNLQPVEPQTIELLDAAPQGEPLAAGDFEVIEIVEMAPLEDDAGALAELDIQWEIESPVAAPADDGPAAGAQAPAAVESDATALPSRLIDVEVDESLVHPDQFDWAPAAPGAPVQGVQPEAADAPAQASEICFGSLCLSPGLYEIFIAEARQRLEALQEEIARDTELTLVTEAARRAVHTLGGIAGTAGFTALAGLAQALEQYWNRFIQAPLPVAHLPLVREVVQRLHDMIAAIEAGQMPAAADPLVAALGSLETEREAASDLPRPPAAPIPAPIAAVPPADGALDVGAFARSTASSPVFERREVADEVDAQLLPIFLEEAEALVPDTSAQLRAWKATPGNMAARAALRRNLHTLKGSARMVGAMRLGELTHVMEARVIAVIEGELAVTADVFDILEAQVDRMADAVDALKRGELQTLADEPAPLAAPIEPVLGHSPEASLAASALDGSEAVAAPTAAPAAGAAVERESNSLTLRVRADWVDRMVNQAGEVAIARSRIESEVFAFKRHVNELSEALVRLRGHIREVEIQAESQMQATFHSQGGGEEFDPLEFDRFTRFQEVTRFLAESVNDISTVQHILLARLGEADAALIQQMRLNRELQQDLLRVRMVPMYSVAERLYRTVRQTARDVGKRAQLDIQGGDLDIDRSVLEKVTAPIEHLLRNALAHGVETPEVRRAAGKPEFGEIVLTARQSGNEMVLTVKDDGAGLDYARIRDKAEAAGLLLPGVEPTETLLAQLIFAAGFSTAETVTQVAGRGVGMDVVKSEISALGGRIDIASTAGAGTTFSIYLPLTLAMTQAVMIRAAKRDYALPAPLVQQVLELRPEELAAAMAAGEVSWRGVRYPLSYLPHLLGDTEAVHEVQRYNAVALLGSGSSYAAVLVDAVDGAREIVVKNIGPQMARVTGVSGATVSGDGRVILILNPVPLALRWASLPRSEVEQTAPAEAVELSAALQPPLVLVVDDSLTVRKITTRLLTREGFRVDSAKDGVDAVEKMQDLIPDVVLLDVEMPRMDGFELARVMRRDARLAQVPIIMITSRTADKHRNHAFEIGVNVYLGKPYQEQQLLDAIAEQLGQGVATA